MAKISNTYSGTIQERLLESAEAKRKVAEQCIDSYGDVPYIKPIIRFQDILSRFPLRQHCREPILYDEEQSYRK